MKIALKQIEPSPHPVRTAWDEGKMEELAQSIKEQGVIVPIKVRPIGDHRHDLVHKWEIVYGHRRAEACRRAGLVYIEVVIEEVEDPNVLIQALIENVVREDLGPMDVARGLQALKDETGWSQSEMARQGIMDQRRISEMLLLLNEPEEIQQIVAQVSKVYRHAVDSDPLAPLSHAGDKIAQLGEHHVRMARQAGLSAADRVKVINKAAEEGLTAKQTRHVADALAQATTPAVRERILKIPVARSPELWTERVKAETHVAQEKETVWWDNYVSTKDFVEQIARTKRLFLRAWESVEKEQIGIEHMPYLAKRLRQLAALLEQMAQQLDDKRIEAIGG